MLLHRGIHVRLLSPFLSVTRLSVSSVSSTSPAPPGPVAQPLCPTLLLLLLPLKLPFFFSVFTYVCRAGAFGRLCRGRRWFGDGSAMVRRWFGGGSARYPFGGSLGPIASHKLDVLREIPATGWFAWRWDRASIVIVPHQRRFAINLSSCRGRADRRIPRSDHARTTLGIPLPRACSINYDRGRSINLPKLDTLSSKIPRESER